MYCFEWVYLLFIFTFVQYFPVGVDVSEGGVGVECGGTFTCGSLYRREVQITL